VDDRLIPWEGHPLAKEVLTTRTVAFLPEEDQEPLLAALAGEADPGVLSPGARSLYELLVNEDPRRTPELAEELPVELRALIERFSPSQVADRIRVPVLAMHSTDDPLVPYAELVRFEAGMPAADTMTVEVFRHVDVEARSLGDWLSLIPDLWRVWHFTTWLLAG
jgi:pimeloyl-ACP methyl ester carboxylesterase